MQEFEVVSGIGVGETNPLMLMAGPCVAESLEICREIAAFAKSTCEELGISYVFKASFDKANRTSISSFRGPGEQAGLEILAEIKREFNLPIVTDVHEPWQCDAVAEVADIIQIPAFLCRQTDLLLAAGATGRVVNVKKGQFMAPEDMASVVKKIQSTGNERIMLTERGTSFGYHNLTVDMRGLVIMSQLGCPVVFDATHSVQLPGGNGTSSGGNREFVAPLARAAAAVGINALFMEIHPDPAKALSDGANSLALKDLPAVLKSVRDIHNLRQQIR
ncbi:MAG: 3-deoxy-8-phosphooctulonate synthase [Victivallales bacterium]|nr:3-deoxy-8-phosphooctulonate synthase [Victivallales bacterium]